MTRPTTRRRTAAIAATALLAALIAAPLSVRAQDAPAPAEETVNLDEKKIAFQFEKASIDAVLAYLSRATGLNFLRLSTVTGDFTAVAASPISVRESLELLRSWLQPKGLTLVVQGATVKILTPAQAKEVGGLPIEFGAPDTFEKMANTDEIITQVMPLKHVRASEVEAGLKDILSEKGKMLVNESSNTLIVTDTSASVRRLAEILNALDKSVSTVLQVRVFPLRNAEATETAAAISEVFQSASTQSQQQGGRGGRGGRGRGRGGRGGGDNNPIRMFFEAMGGGENGGGASAGQVTITADNRTNSLIVAASADQMKLIEELITELDRAPQAIVTEIRVYPLVNADATELKTALEELLEQDSEVASNSRNSRRGGRGGRNVPGFMRRFMQQQGEQETNRYQTEAKITVDTRTNSLIVSATPAQFAVIDQLVAELDRDPTEKESILVVPLEHADATEVAEILNDILEDQQNLAGRNNRNNRNNRRNRNNRNTNQNTEPGSGDLVGEVRVVADPAANAIVVATSPKNFERLEKLVKDLDRVRREVLIECVIAEVTLSNKDELGIQWQAVFNGSLDDDPNGQQTVGLDLGLPQDGLTYTTMGEHLTALVRALQTEGKLEVLSSPKILVLNNEDAEISVGQEVPFITNSRITNQGDTINTVQYRNVGIILQVTPSINEAGYVRMQVHPEVSQRRPDSEGVQISPGVISPVFAKNFADTNIVVKDGQTAVIGGLMSDSENETRRKIPILGDIPLLGYLFGATETTTMKTELVVFLTPRVVKDDRELQALTNQQEAELTRVPDKLIERSIERWTRELDSSSWRAYYNRGTILLENKRYQEAVIELQEAANLAPQEHKVWFNLGLAYAHTDELEKAYDAFLEAAILDPADAETRWNLGATLWRLGDMEGAKRELQATVTLEPKHADAAKWLQIAAADKQAGSSAAAGSSGPRTGAAARPSRPQGWRVPPENAQPRMRIVPAASSSIGGGAE